MSAYYNENEPYCAQWLHNLIAAGHIPPGDVDDRSIADVHPVDLLGYTQVHLFAGIGGWGLAARLAGWPDARTLWTASCPCQPFSVAGKGLGADDPRHLWPHVFRLARALRPSVLMGEQVAAAIKQHWFDGVCADLESIGYAVGAAVVPACAVDAPHGRDRLYFVADANGAGIRNEPGRERGTHGSGAWVDFDAEQSDVGDTEVFAKREPHNETDAIAGRGETWSVSRGASRWIIGADGKARRVKPGVRLLAHGIPARVAKLRAGGNAIVPPLAAEVLRAYMDCAPWQ